MIEKDRLYLETLNGLIECMTKEQRAATLNLIDNLRAVCNACPDEDVRAAAFAMVSVEMLLLASTPNESH